MAHWAAWKGLSVLGTGDFTHPTWMEELETHLEPDGDTGLFRLRTAFEASAREDLASSCPLGVRFMLQVEVSCVYRKADRTRKVHHLIYAKTFEQAKALSRRLADYGKLASDGRPTLKLDSKDLLDMVLQSGEDLFLVPAHIWTPWFSLLGNRSGFDSVEACFEELTPHIHAVESGLSADPIMIRQVDQLNRYQIISSSDAHAPHRLGREATAFACDRRYDAIRHAIETGTGLVGTMEFFPEEGKYYLSGHRKCGYHQSTRQTVEDSHICPVCNKPSTMGVRERIDSLCQEHHGPAEVPPLRHQLGLDKILSDLLGVGPTSKKVQTAYFEALRQLGPELPLLHQIPFETIAQKASPSLADAIQQVRTGRVSIQPGFDGQYGHVRLMDPE